MGKAPKDRVTCIVEVPAEQLKSPRNGILLCQEIYSLAGEEDRYGLPGGGIEKIHGVSQTPEEAARDELAQELNLVLIQSVVLGVQTFRNRVHHILAVQAEGNLMVDDDEVVGIQAFAAGWTLPEARLKSHVRALLLGETGFVSQRRAGTAPQLLSHGVIIPEDLRPQKPSLFDRLTRGFLMR